jgi:SAM-dependent methyltransferase
MNVEKISGSLQLDHATGIWSAARTVAVAYPEGDHGTCFAVEDNSFWFRHRNRSIVAAVRRFRPDGFVLDVGGGNGFVARALMDAGFDTVVLEPGPEGARNARRSRQIPDVICATLEDAAIFEAAVPAVGMFDVLEHIEDDGAALAEVHRILKPGGYLYLTVPAFNWLWSAADADALHFRRYSRSLLTKVISPHFELVFLTALFGRLVPAFFLTRTVPYALGRRSRSAKLLAAEHRAGGPLVGGAIERLLAHEVERVADGRELQVGSTLLAVGRRR